MIEDVDQYILIGEVSMGTLNVTFQVTAVFERISSHRVPPGLRGAPLLTVAWIF